MEIRHIVKIYSTKTTEAIALNDVSIRFPQTGMVFVVGKSGCGKSTLLNVLGGLDKPTSGQVIFNDQKICFEKEQYLDEYRKDHIGFVFQDHLLVDNMTVEENVASVLSLQGKEVQEDKIVAALDAVGIGDLADRLPNALSGGQRQRAAIARALIKEPSVILADEPTGNLDSESGKMVLNTLKRISQNLLVIVVSHDMDFAYGYADRIIELKDGKVCKDIVKTADCDWESIKEKYLTEVESAFVPTDLSDSAEEDLPTRRTHAKSTLGMRDAFKTMLCWLKATMHSPKSIAVTLCTILMMALALAALGIFNDMRTYTYARANEASLHNKDYDMVMLLKKDVYTLAADETTGDDYFSQEQYKDVARTFDAHKAYYYYYQFKTYHVVGDDYEANSGHFNAVCEINGTFDQTSLAKFYSSKLVAGTYPKIENGVIEMLISDVLADKILLNGCAFENGIVLPNTHREEIVGKEFVDNSIRFRIAGIYSCQYSQIAYSEHPTDSDIYLFAKDYIYPVVLCAEDAVLTFANSVVGIGTQAEFKPKGSGAYLTYNSVFVAASSTLLIDKASEQLEVPVKYAEGMSMKLLADKDIILSYSHYLELFNQYRYDEEGNMIATFDNLDPKQLRNRTVIERIDDQETEYRLIGVYDDTDVPANVVVVSASRKEKHINQILRIPVIYVKLSNHGQAVNRLLRYLDDKGYYSYAEYSFRLYQFETLFGILKGIINISTVVLLIFVIMLVAIVIGKNLREREKDIGILRALGANKRDITKIFVFNDIFYMVTSFALSLLFYYVGTLVFNASVSMQFAMNVTVMSFRWISILIMLGVSLAVVSVASYLPIRKYSNASPVNVIKGN